MTILEIKAQLSIEAVLRHYGIEVNRNGHIKCPFHDDQKASMKVYSDTNTVYCFAGTCKTAGHSLDVIDFIMYMENCTKHEAILKAKNMLGHVEPMQKQVQPKTPKVSSNLTLEDVFKYMQNGFSRTRSAQEYAAKRGLDFLNLEIGYSSGQMHYKKDAQYLSDLEALHIIKPLEKGGHLTFAKNGIIFPLKDSAGQVCSLYGRSIDKKGHYYLTGRCGLYPGYPPSETKKVLLVESVIDAATLLQIKELSDYFILALYGTNGLTAEHKTALQALPNLEEVVLMLDGDEAGRKAASQYKSELSQLFCSIDRSSIEVKKVDLPQDADVNELWVNHHEPQLFLDLLESSVNTESQAFEVTPKLAKVTPSKREQPAPSTRELDRSEAANLKYCCTAAKYYVKGFASSINKGLDSLKVTLVTENKHGKTYRSRVELYEDRDLRKYCKEVAERLELDEGAILLEISELADELEKYRNELLAAKGSSKITKMPIPAALAAEARAFGAAANFYERLNAKLGATGIVGEEEARFLLFSVATSYMQEKPLHVLIQGSSGSGKTLLLRGIMGLLPEDKGKVYTRITEKSLYHTGSKLSHTTTAIEDWDGLPPEVQYIFREFQTGGGLSSLSTVKDEAGDSDSADIRAYGPIASMMCTTQGSVYEDNMSRCFLVAVDESEEQTKRILEYQNARRRGDIDKKAEEEAKEFIRNFIEVLEPCEVVNPYAGKVSLPHNAHKIRRLNELYLVFVEQITWLHQFQREKDENGRLIVTKEDLKLACHLLFETIILKVDELDGALRMFFEELKNYALEKGGQNEQFNRREIRQALNLSKTQQHRFLQDLEELEYIRLVGGYANKGYCYKIVYWDDNQRLRKELKQFLDDQLNKL
jgi:DNA primase